MTGMERASLGRLADSHRRLDDVMDRLLAAARRLAAGRPDAGDVAAVQGAASELAEAARRHFLDEDGSVFPRLSTRRPELAEAIARLSAEHAPQIAMQTALADAAKALDGGSRPGAGKVLLELAEKFGAQQRAHDQQEETLLADAGGALTAEDDAEIAAEMATREQRDERREIVAKPKASAKPKAKPAKKPPAKKKPAKRRAR